MISAVGILYGLITLIAISHSSSSEEVTPAPITPAPVTPSPTVDSPCDDCSSFNITADSFSSVAPSSTCPAINVDPSPSDSSDEAPDASEMISCGDPAQTISECLILGEDSSSDSGDATEPENVLVDICIEYDIGGELDDLCFDNETVAIFLPLCNNTVLDVDDDGILAALDLLISSLTFEDGTNVAVAEGDVIDDVPGIVVELTANNVTGFELCLTNIILEQDEVDTIDIANYSMSMSMGSLLINDTFIIDCDFDGLPCFNFYIEGDCAGVLPDDSGDSSDSSSAAIAESESSVDSASSASDSGSDSGSASASASASASGSASGSGDSGDSASGDSASGDSASGSSGAAGVASASADSGDSSGATATGGDSSGATATGGDSSDEGTTAVLSAGGSSEDVVAVAATGNTGGSSSEVVATPQPTVAGGTPSPTTAIVSGGSSDSDEVDPTPRPTARPTAVVTVPTTPAPTAATVSVIAASASDDNVRVRVRSRNRRRADSSEAVTVSSVTPSPVTVSVIAGGSSETRVRVRSRNRRNRGGDDSSDDDAKAIFGDADNEEYAVVNGGDGGKLEVNFSHWTLANIWAVMIGFGALNVFLYYCVGCGGKKGKKGIFARKYEKTDTEEPDMNDFGNGNDSDSA